MRLSHTERFVALWCPTVLVLTFGALSYWGALREQRSRAAVTDSYRVTEQLQLLLNRLLDAETGQRGYLLTDRASYLRPFGWARADVQQHLAELRRLTSNNRRENVRLDSLSMIVGAKFEEMEQTIAIRRAGRLDEALAIVGTDRGLRTMSLARELADAIRRDEAAELNERSHQETRNNLVLVLILILGSVVAAAAAGVMSHVLDRYAASQERIAHELEQANDQLQDQQVELEAQNEQLVEQATELEAQADELQAQTEQLTELTVELEARTEAAEAANKAKATFLAAMSHDLRTPLNAILGYADLMAMGLRGEVTAAQARDLERIRSSGRSLLALINDILNFARLEAGRVNIVLQSVGLDAALHDLQSLFLPQLHARGLRYRYDGCDPDLTVQADPDRMEQILLNLVSNAVKFTAPNGEVVIEVEAHDDVSVHVRDTGIGIPTDALQRIFEPFVQVDPRRMSGGDRGVGLGLAISRELARAMGGDLSVQSKPGVGSTFTLRLRRARPATSQGDEAAERAAQAA